MTTFSQRVDTLMGLKDASEGASSCDNDEYGPSKQMNIQNQQNKIISGQSSAVPDDTLHRVQWKPMATNEQQPYQY